MKIDNKRIISIIFIILISFDTISANVSKTSEFRKSRSKLSRKGHKTHAKKFNIKTAIGSIFSKLNDFITDPFNIFYFLLGVMSAFNDNVDEIYKKIKDFKEAIDPCINTLKTAYNTYKSYTEKPNTEEISKPLKEVEVAFNNQENKKEYCEKTKHEIDANYEKTIEEHIQHQGLIGETYNSITPAFMKSFATKMVGKVVGDWDYCMAIRYSQAPKMQAHIKKVYKNPFTYEKQCLYFHKLDCDTFKPEINEVWELVKKADKLYDFVLTTGECIQNIVAGVKPDSEDKVKNFVNLLKEILPRDKIIKDTMAAVIGVVLQIATLGSWGGLKAGYYVLDLYEKIKKYYDDVTGDAAFNIGKTLGTGLIVAKSFVTGRKRKFRKNKRN